MSNELPKGWIWATFSQLGEWHGGGTPSKRKPEFWNDGTIPWVSPKDMKVYYIENTIDYITSDAVEKSTTKLIPANSLLVVVRSGILRHTFPVAINKVECTVNQDLKALSLSKYIDPKYMLLVSSALNKDILNSCSKNGTTVQSIETALLYNYRIPLSPASEQARIVSKIEELFTKLDAGIESLKQTQILLKKYRQSVLKSAVEGKLTSEWRQQHKDELEPAERLLERILKERREKWEAEQLANFKAKGKKPPKNWQNKYKEPTPPDTSDLPDLPEGWQWVNAEQITSLVTDGEHITPKRTQKGIPQLPKSELGDQVLLLSARNIQDGYLSFEKVDYITQETYRKLKQRLNIQSGDVLLSCSGTVGRSCISPSNPDFALVRSVAVLKPLLKMGNYMSYCIRSSILQSQIHERKTQTAQANIFQNQIKKLVFPLAPIKEQEAIITIIEKIFSNAEKADSSIEIELKRSNSLRQSILKHAFEGKLVPQDPNDEPASVLLERIKAEKSKLKN